MNKIFKLIIFLPILSCKQEGSQERAKVFLTIEKAVDKDGLYHNLSEPGVLYIKHNGEVSIYFLESDSTNRKTMDYTEGYNLYKRRYKESFYELLPSDFNKYDPTKTFNAVVIDTVKKSAYSTQAYGIYRMF